MVEKMKNDYTQKLRRVITNSVVFPLKRSLDYSKSLIMSSNVNQSHRKAILKMMSCQRLVMLLTNDLLDYSSGKSQMKQAIDVCILRTCLLEVQMIFEQDIKRKNLDVELQLEQDASMNLILDR